MVRLWYSKTRFGMAGQGARLGRVQGKAWYGKTRFGMARQGKERGSTA